MRPAAPLYLIKRTTTMDDTDEVGYSHFSTGCGRPQLKTFKVLERPSPTTAVLRYDDRGTTETVSLRSNGRWVAKGKTSLEKRFTTIAFGPVPADLAEEVHEANQIPY